MTEHERIELLSEMRMFYHSAPVILPLIQKRKTEALGRLLQKYKSGDTNTIAVLAELSAFTDLETEIRQKEATYKTLEKETEKKNGK